MAPETLLTYWYRALEEELGLLIEVNNPSVFKQQLYNARKMENDPKLMSLIVLAPATNDRLFIAKKSVELEPA